MYGCEGWTVRKAEHWRMDAFELWCWRRLLRVPWTARISSQSILKEIRPGCSLEGLMLKLKSADRKSWLVWKDTQLHKWKKAIHSRINNQSVQFSRSVMSYSLRPQGLKHDRLPCPSPTPRTYSNSCPSHRRCHSTTSSSVVHSPPTCNLSQHQGLFQGVGSSHQVAKVVEFQLQHQSSQQVFRTDFL